MTAPTRARLRAPPGPGGRSAQGGGRCSSSQASERALAAEPWLRETMGLRVHIRPEGALTAAAGTRDHQGVVAFCEPYSLRGRLGARRRRAAAASSASTASPTRTTSARSAGARGCGRDGRGRAGARRGEGHGRRLPRVGRRGRAPAGRGRRQPRALPGRGQARRSVGLGGGGGAPRRRSGRPTSRAARRSSSAPRAGFAARRAPRLRRRARDPARRGGRVAERQRRVRDRPLRGGAAEARPVPEPTLTSSTATTCCTRSGSRARDELSTGSPISSPCAARAGSSSSTAWGRTGELGSLEVSFAENADGVIERVIAETRTQERVAVVSSDAAIRETRGPPRAAALVDALRAGAGTRGVGARADVARLVPGRGRARPGDPRRSREAAPSQRVSRLLRAAAPPSRAERELPRARGS